MQPSTHRYFLTLAFPNVLANLVLPLANMIDLAILGHLSEATPLAGAAIAGVVFDIIYLSLNFLRIGTTGLTALSFGAQNKEASAAVFFRGMAIALVAGITIVFLQTPIKNLGFSILTQDPAVGNAGMAYYSARIMGAPAALGSYVIIGWLLGRQKSKAVLLLTFILSVANIFGDWLFILKWDMGAAGAGLATMISEYLVFFSGLLMVKTAWGDLPQFRLAWLTGGFRPLFKLQANILIRTLCLTSTFSLFTYISGRIDTQTLTANTVLLRLLQAAALFIDGYAFALEAMTGRLHGAGDKGAVRGALRIAMGWNVGTVLIFILAFSLFGDHIIHRLITYRDAADLAIKWMPLLCITLAISGFAYILDGLFIGMAAGGLLRSSMLISTLFGFLPLAAWSMITGDPQILWSALILFMIFRASTLGRKAWGLNENSSHGQ